VRNKYQRKERKSNHKFEVVRGQELPLTNTCSIGSGGAFCDANGSLSSETVGDHSGSHSGQQLLADRSHKELEIMCAILPHAEIKLPY
jgi:hypothetical protein